MTSNGTFTHVQGTFNSLPATTFLIQFFTSPTADPSGYGQGKTLLGSTQLTTDGGGNAPIDLSLAVDFPAGVVLAATATNLATGDTSEFSAAIPESPAFAVQPPSLPRPSQAARPSSRSSGRRSTGTSSVHYATVAGGRPPPGVDYIATSGTLVVQAR